MIHQQIIVAVSQCKASKSIVV